MQLLTHSLITKTVLSCRCTTADGDRFVATQQISVKEVVIVRFRGALNESHLIATLFLGKRQKLYGQIDVKLQFHKCDSATERPKSTHSPLLEREEATTSNNFLDKIFYLCMILWKITWFTSFFKAQIDVQKVSFDNEGVKNHFIIVLLNGPFMFAWFHILLTGVLSIICQGVRL